MYDVREVSEGFYEVEVGIALRKSSILIVHLRAGSPQEAQRRALRAATEKCDVASYPEDIGLDSYDFEYDSLEVEGIERCSLRSQGEAPYWSDPNIDLRSEPTDREIENAKVNQSEQLPLPFDDDNSKG